MTRIKRIFEALHPDMQGFLGFVLWGALFWLGLEALETRHYTVVRIYICAGAIGIVCVGKWLIDVGRAK